MLNVRAIIYNKMQYINPNKPAYNQYSYTYKHEHNIVNIE